MSADTLQYTQRKSFHSQSSGSLSKLGSLALSWNAWQEFRQFHDLSQWKQNQTKISMNVKFQSLLKLEQSTGSPSALLSCFTFVSKARGQSSVTLWCLVFLPEKQSHRKLVFNWMLEFLPRFLACLEGGSTRTFSWLPFTAASSRAFRAGEEAMTFLNTEEYRGPICMRFCKAKSCRLLITEVADPRALSSRRKEMRTGRRQATSWEPVGEKGHSSGFKHTPAHHVG